MKKQIKIFIIIFLGIFAITFLYNAGKDIYQFHTVFDSYHYIIWYENNWYKHPYIKLRCALTKSRVYEHRLENGRRQIREDTKIGNRIFWTVLEE